MNYDQLWEDIKANTAKLNACPRHAFGSVVGDRTLGVRSRHNKRTCQNCGGTMEDSAIVTYTRGYKAAGGNPDDIMKFVDGESLT